MKYLIKIEDTHLVEGETESSELMIVGTASFYGDDYKIRYKVLLIYLLLGIVIGIIVSFVFELEDYKIVIPISIILSLIIGIIIMKVGKKNG